jgi:hypothetical protein
MKALAVISIFVYLTTLLSAQGPATWSQTTAYTHPALVINGTTTYLSLQNVPANTDITNTTYWSTLDNLVPNETPSGSDSLSTPDASEVSDLAVPDGAGSSDIKLKGISTNAIVTADAFMVAGVQVTGGTKKVVFQVQATGTYDAGTGFLTDPILYVTNAAGTVVATVDNWNDGPDAGYDASLYSTSYLAELQNSSYAMNANTECAIILNLPEGSYTALVGANGESSGKAVVAAFEFETGSSVSKLKGISTNATVTADAFMVAGVQVTGGTKKVVFQVQATGTYDAGTGFLTDPILYVTNAAGTVVATVDNWNDGPDAGYDASLYSASYLTELQNSSYAMNANTECAIILNLPEGSYTALVGANGESSGKAVVAAFDFE